MELLGNVKNYEWGKVGAVSKVAQLAKLNCDEFAVEPSNTYAELWMGDHVSGPSSVKVTGALLSDTFKGNRSLLSAAGHGQPLDRLPFLFKVLSVQKALSIQVHPNKSQAEFLHKQFPDVYKDDNHKPELAIALTTFLALCGFREYQEIAAYLDAIAPLKSLIGEENAKALSGPEPADGLKRCFTKLMTATDAEIVATIKGVAEVIPTFQDQEVIRNIFAKVSAEYPGDLGILSIFFLNIIELQPGEAIFLAANEPHAYLSGDCIEIMACSDNVIRAGLTPKFKDVKTLLEMVNYTAEPKSRKYFEPEICCDGFSKLFIPPVKDFAAKEIRVPSQSAERYQLKNWFHGSILLVLEGHAQLTMPAECNLPPVQVKPGSIIFLPGCKAEWAASELKLQLSADDDTFLAYQGFYNEFH